MIEGREVGLWGYKAIGTEIKKFPAHNLFLVCFIWSNLSPHLCLAWLGQFIDNNTVYSVVKNPLTNFLLFQIFLNPANIVHTALCS